MARHLGNWSCLEARAVSRYLWAKNVPGSDIHSQIVEVYGEEAMSRQRVATRCHSFQSGRHDVENRNMAGSNRPNSLRHELKKFFKIIDPECLCVKYRQS
ncbi:histone-lysine N-methyltransferase SETMAR [Trichonephila clavipes]|nr:histone-lysine N-methyltransferase SETMAR [Trichonephila clavipes]